MRRVGNCMLLAVSSFFLFMFMRVSNEIGVPSDGFIEGSTLERGPNLLSRVRMGVRDFFERWQADLIADGKGCISSIDYGKRLNLIADIRRIEQQICESEERMAQTSDVQQE